MIHATFRAIVTLLGATATADLDAAVFWNMTARRACDWSIQTGDELTEPLAKRLLDGVAGVALPTCPVCAVFVDQALEQRGAQ